MNWGRIPIRGWIHKKTPHTIWGVIFVYICVNRKCQDYVYIKWEYLSVAGQNCKSWPAPHCKCCDMNSYMYEICLTLYFQLEYYQKYKSTQCTHINLSSIFIFITWVMGQATFWKYIVRSLTFIFSVFECIVLQCVYLMCILYRSYVRCCVWKTRSKTDLYCSQQHW